LAFFAALSFLRFVAKQKKARKDRKARKARHANALQTNGVCRSVVAALFKAIGDDIKV